MKWRRINLPGHLAAFKRAKNYASNQLNTARTKYLSDFISENSDNRRKLCRATNALLAQPRTLSVPDNCDAESVADDIGNYFAQKVSDICAKLNQNTDNQPACITSAGSCNYTHTFSNCKELAVEDVMTLISRSSKKSCPADPMPTPLTV